MRPCGAGFDDRGVTYSIVARDSVTGEFGVAVQSAVLAVGTAPRDAAVLLRWLAG
ncbi:hypothetical protein GCM10010428_41630 [Actinosynnema pretiosum subsp. pretiosum]